MNRSQWTRLATSAGAAALLPAWAQAAVPPAAGETIEIVRSRWEVRPGLVVPIRTYGGSVPGKELRLNAGQRASIRVTNRSGETQTVHWHGLIVPDTVDGVPELGTPPIAAGASQRYDFAVRPAGSRWYHSHLHEGLFSGMYGPLIVADPHEHAGYDREIVLMLGAFGARIPKQSSMLEARPAGSPGLTRPAMNMGGMGGMMNESGNSAMGGMSMGGSGGSMSAMMTMRDAVYRSYAINGKALHAGNPIRVKRGERLRLRIYNATPTKTLRIALPGHRFTVTHLDGNPVPVQRSIDALELGVAERIDAIVTMDTPGNWILGSTVAGERANGLGIVVAYDGAHGSPAWHDGARDTFHYTAFGHGGGPLPSATRTDLVLRKSPLSADAWSVNGKVYPHTTDIPVVAGRAYLIRFLNMSMMEHPMHLHGHGFELVAVDGVATSGIIKDTVTVRPMGGSVDVLLRANNPFGGRFLLHCHNEQHMSGGMATIVRYL
jgi:FtsP/CotA-like multicopper oxidase with cupredoxin domain